MHELLAHCITCATAMIRGQGANNSQVLRSGDVRSGYYPTWVEILHTARDMFMEGACFGMLTVPAPLTS